MLLLTIKIEPRGAEQRGAVLQGSVALSRHRVPIAGRTGTPGQAWPAGLRCARRVRDVQGTVSAPYSLNSLCRLTLPALLREGAVFCKAMVLVLPAGLEGWGTRESETAVEKGEKTIQIIHMFFVLAVFLLKKVFICYRCE